MYSNDPQNYCRSMASIEQKFATGGSVMASADSEECQTFWANKCSQGWDGVCRQVMDNPELPNQPRTSRNTSGSAIYLNNAQQILGMTARQRFLSVMMGGDDCRLNARPFDPIRPDTPTITSFEGSTCSPIYLPPPPNECDRDPVLNRILDQLDVAPDVLAGMVDACLANVTWENYRSTKLYRVMENERHKMKSMDFY